MTNTYNGYTNYATWNVMLWIDNDESSYRTKVDLLKQQPSINAMTAREICKACLGRSSTPDLVGNTTEGCRWKDVNWQEIADLLTEEQKEYANE